MKIVHENIEYDTIYFPFFRLAKCEDFQVFGLRYPSGFVEEMVVFDSKNIFVELKEHLHYLLKEFALEDDLLLTPRALELKNELRILFGIAIVDSCVIDKT